MDQSSLVAEEIEAGDALLRALHGVLPVKVAFWLKASEDDRRYLYVASDDVKPGQLGKANHELGQVMRGMRSLWLDFFRVKLIAGDDPLAVDAASIQQRFPDPLGTRLHGGRFGGVTVDDVYIYPLAQSASVSVAP